jgi:methylmalonyl-CoA mutase cobalamin-binding domain/chain
MGDVPVLCGGNIPKRAAEQLLAAGVAAVFPPGSSRQAILDYVFAVGSRRPEAKRA